MSVGLPGARGRVLARSWPLLVVLSLGGCQLYEAQGPMPAAPTGSPSAPRFGQLRTEAQAGGGRSVEEWRDLLRDEVLSGGWVGGKGPGRLAVYATRRVLPDRLSEALHVLTLACYPRRATVLVRASALFEHAGGMGGLATVSVPIDRVSSLFLAFYPPAWGLEPGADLLAEAVRSATRAACGRLEQARLRLRAPSGAGLAQPAATCPSCGAEVEATWIACPRCAARLGE